MRKMNLVELESGESGVVVSIAGGRAMRSRLEALGIRVGVEIRKVSAQLLRGPVTVRVGGTQLAIGFGMAGRIVVEVPE
jgi:ferrous iron transport protein A